MTVTITLAGVRGGQGTSTTAAALALHAARRAERVELVAHDADATAALLGLSTAPAADQGIALTEQLTLRTEPSGTALVVIVDAGPLCGLTERPEGLLVAVVRGPCYLSLRAVVTHQGPRPDGIIVVREPGRSLTCRDVADVTGIATFAETVASPAVARTVDAGVLPVRAQRLTDLTPLDQWLKQTLIDLTAAPPTAPASAVTEQSRDARFQTARIDTDLPVALSATGRERRAVAFGVGDAHRSCCVERREVKSGSRRVLRRRSRELGRGLLRRTR
jgi:hypothetical protein